MIDTEDGPRALTYAELKARKKRREITHPVVTDDDAVTAYRQAREHLNTVRFTADPDTVAAAKAALDDAEAAVRSSTLIMRLRALPREGAGSYAVLKAEHPPTDADDKDVQESTGNPKSKARWHTETFAPAVVAASLVEPKVTVAEAAEMYSDWNEGEWTALYMAALDVNQLRTDTAGLTFS